jgi:hypothetical protein
MNLDRVTDSHVESNILDDTQECFNNSSPQNSFSWCLCELVEESSLVTLEASLLNDSSSQQNASIAFGYYYCEIEADAP